MVDGEKPEKMFVPLVLNKSYSEIYMKFGELTIAQILLAAFSGFGIVVLTYVFGKKAIGRYKSSDKRTEIIQDNNEVQGDLAGGNIIKTNTIEHIESKRTDTKVNQTDNKVGGDMAGGNIIKGRDE